MDIAEITALEEDFTAALKASPDPSFQSEVLTSRSGAVPLLQGSATPRPKSISAKRSFCSRLRIRGTSTSPPCSNVAAISGKTRQPTRQGSGAAQQMPALSYQRAFYTLASDEHEGARRISSTSWTRNRVMEHPIGPSRRIELAHLRLLAGEKSTALADCDALLASRPTCAEAHRQRAEILLALDKHREAEAALRRYLDLGGKPTPEVFRALGLLAAQRRDYATAVDAYSAALHAQRDAGIRAAHGGSNHPNLPEGSPSAA